MNLRELQTEVENAIRATYEHGENPEDVIVTLQVDDPEDPHHGYACGTEEVTLHYDGNWSALLGVPQRRGKTMKTWKRFCCWIGWHSYPHFQTTGFDGASVHAKCRWCGYEGMIDSQGNLF